MVNSLDEIVKEIGAELRLDPTIVRYMVKAYDLEPVRTYFTQKYAKEIDGENPILAFCRKCREEKDLREQAYRWMSIAEDVGRGRLMFSEQSNQ